MLYNIKNPHGGDIYDKNRVIDLSANTSPFKTPEGVLRAISGALHTLDRYPDPYCRELICAIAEHERLPKSYILCSNGAAEMIYSFCYALKPLKAVETAPTFSEYSLALENVGTEISRYLLKAENEFDIKEDFFELLELEKPAAVFLCNPNNPTGRVISKKLLLRLLDICREREIRLFLDESFVDLCDNAVSMTEYLESYPQLFILKAFTKSYGMAGIRLGYGLCSDERLLYEMSKTVQPWNVSTVAQAAGVAALRERLFLQRTKKLISSERPRLKAMLERLGCRVCDGSANYLLFSAEYGLDKKLLQRGIMIRSCENCHGLGEGWFRTAVKLPRDSNALIEAIKEIKRGE